MSHAAMLRPGSTIGILGGGQLARMIALAAAPLGLKTHIYAPEAGSPAFDVATAHSRAAYDDTDALDRFAAAVDVVTYEFENVPVATAEHLAKTIAVHPGTRALGITQERLLEKSFVAGLGIETAPFAKVDTLEELEEALSVIGRPAVLKTRRFGYDGKGQTMIREGDSAASAFDAIGRHPAILEGFVPFVREVSVVAARRADGAFAAYEVTENEHRHHILHRSTVPANVTSMGEAAAGEIARQIADALGYVGVFAVELFVVGSGIDERIVVNEIAPRVHNSGHWTLDGADTSQFEQHVRAISGWPLGSTARRGPRVEMTNLIGDEAGEWHHILETPGAHLHLYGKAEARAGRKMGHWTRVLPE
ncbi:5-(carboxyamino)imidazole ribonucleotide synthase [Ancylobacter sp. 6x-1]|uniref:N5-carboxyaminoimidazole ribonucleotide synthase n=1 Tax=Ancylobacter crimeensis TaxID=2579147 RepID=A0ABT0DE89_9HYPH|nr:5-(carboxyamino)imidazole ribonucleotide synthase [Ancylobacter crimeensis]MCK0198262.1 5-(carboxyamino)imidazole ribonucleotide synthase [Ancylobacter crimeensis]